MKRIGPGAIATCVWLSVLSWGASDAWACSCADWDSMGAAEARKAFLADWARAEAAVSGTTTAVGDRETLVRVTRVHKGSAPDLLRVFPLPAQGRSTYQGGLWSPGVAMDCRPLLRNHTEYLVLLFRQSDGTLDGERCAVWADSARRRRQAWIPERR